MALSFSLSRRQAIVLAGSALAAAALPASLIFIERENGNLAGELVAALADPEGAAGIGRIWIASLEREVAAPVLAHKIAKRLRAHGWVPGDTPEKLHAALAARVRRDFTRNEMASIHGWQIARTSAELCALAALSLDTGRKADHEANAKG